MSHPMPAPTPTWSWNFLPSPATLKDVRRCARGYARWFPLKVWHPEASDEDKLRVLCARALHLLHGPATMVGTQAVDGFVQAETAWGEGNVGLGTKAFVEDIMDSLIARMRDVQPRGPFTSADFGRPLRFRSFRVSGFEGEYAMVNHNRQNYAATYPEATDDSWFPQREAWWGLRTPLFTTYRRGQHLRTPQPEHYVRLWLTLNRGWDIDPTKLQAFEEYLNAPTGWTYCVLPDTTGTLRLAVGADPNIAPDPESWWGEWSGALTATQPPFRTAELTTAAEVVEPFFTSEFYGWDASREEYNYWFAPGPPVLANLWVWNRSLLFTQKVPRQTIVWEGQTIRKVPSSWHKRAFINRTLKPAFNWQSTVRRSSKLNALQQL